MSDEEIEEAIEVFVQELATEEVVEVLEEVNDIGVQNLSQATEETQVVIQQVVEKAVENVEDLSDDQVEVVAEVLQVQTEDVEIIAEAVKEDEVVAEAVEEYVERAVDNADVENYTLADVVTEVQFETFLENPIETFVDIDVTEINITTIGNDMTQDQKEKAQEVVVPVILTRIATMAAFVFRKTL
jgi:MoaA/NifB/PqqE/SkfB family radical SAM enzyme